uniref:Uncharacterized protein n=1 Tax=Romanomermis culicivorax TaxID=13658 RepID=A0A915JNA5_ROMCU
MLQGSGKESFRNLLYQIERALGYYDDPRYEFTIGEEKVKLSAHAFCAAIIEVIPFTSKELRDSVTDCREL